PSHLRKPLTHLLATPCSHRLHFHRSFPESILTRPLCEKPSLSLPSSCSVPPPPRPRKSGRARPFPLRAPAMAAAAVAVLPRITPPPPRAISSSNPSSSIPAKPWTFPCTTAPWAPSRKTPPARPPTPS